MQIKLWAERNSTWVNGTLGSLQKTVKTHIFHCLIYSFVCIHWCVCVVPSLHFARNKQPFYHYANSLRWFSIFGITFTSFHFTLTWVLKLIHSFLTLTESHAAFSLITTFNNLHIRIYQCSKKNIKRGTKK